MSTGQLLFIARCLLTLLIVPAVGLVAWYWLPWRLLDDPRAPAPDDSPRPAAAPADREADVFWLEAAANGFGRFDSPHAQRLLLQLGAPADVVAYAAEGFFYGGLGGDDLAVTITLAGADSDLLIAMLQQAMQVEGFDPYASDRHQGSLLRSRAFMIHLGRDGPVDLQLLILPRSSRLQAPGGEASASP